MQMQTTFRFVHPDKNGLNFYVHELKAEEVLSKTHSDTMNQLSSLSLAASDLSASEFSRTACACQEQTHYYKPAKF
jgi:hypothetical protein